jgi:hypothetical protein
MQTTGHTCFVLKFLEFNSRVSRKDKPTVYPGSLTMKRPLICSVNRKVPIVLKGLKMAEEG